MLMPVQGRMGRNKFNIRKLSISYITAYPEAVYLKSHLPVLEVHVAILPGSLKLLCEIVCACVRNYKQTFLIRGVVGWSLLWMNARGQTLEWTWMRWMNTHCIFHKHSYLCCC